MLFFVLRRMDPREQEEFVDEEQYRMEVLYCCLMLFPSCADLILRICGLLYEMTLVDK